MRLAQLVLILACLMGLAGGPWSSPAVEAQQSSPDITREGTIVSIDRSARSFVLSMTTGAPRQITVLAQTFTQLSVVRQGSAVPARFASLAVGDRIIVNMLVLANGQAVAVTARVVSRGAVSPVSTGPSGAPAGTGPAPAASGGNGAPTSTGSSGGSASNGSSSGGTSVSVNANGTSSSTGSGVSGNANGTSSNSGGVSVEANGSGASSGGGVSAGANGNASSGGVSAGASAGSSTGQGASAGASASGGGVSAGARTR